MAAKFYPFQNDKGSFLKLVSNIREMQCLFTVKDHFKEKSLKQAV
jgi:hypothetical protein